MTSLLFVRKPHVYLPEISAYRQYLAEHFPGVEIAESTEAGAHDPADYDIIWHFMGFDLKGSGGYVIHEYNSLSTPPLARVKNVVKCAFNKQPHRRVFLSRRVRDDFGFRDGVPCHLRDMGIDKRFFGIVRDAHPEYDFIYAGGLNRGPIITTMLDRFAGPLHEARILLVGDAPPAMKERYKDASNIIFPGRVAYHDVPALMVKARYGLNIMPDSYPFNIQTATKVLEYCAAGLPVVTTDYEWVRAFEQAQGARFFRLTADCGNLSMDRLAAFDFRIPSVASMAWDNIIAESGIFDFLKTG